MPQRVAETVGKAEIDAFLKNVTKMLDEEQPLILNGEDWGFGGYQFEEVLV